MNKQILVVYKSVTGHLLQRCRHFKGTQSRRNGRSVPRAFRRTGTQQSKNGIADRLYRFNTTIFNLRYKSLGAPSLRRVP